jgi:hypothetical protein
MADTFVTYGGVQTLEDKHAEFANHMLMPWKTVEIVQYHHQATNFLASVSRQVAAFCLACSLQILITNVSQHTAAITEPAADETQHQCLNVSNKNKYLSSLRLINILR